MNNTPKKILEILLTGDLAEIDHLATELNRFFDDAGIDALVKNQVNLILEELYTNTANYGFQGITNGEVTITLSLIDGQLEMVYQDNGIAFNPLEIEDPDLLLGIEDRPIGGLGVFFVKAMTDQVEYSHVGEFNQLKMQKKVY